MRKHGPCRHCGVKETPLWRNGPPEKPVLCNACGSRWRIQGNLDNYLPNIRGQVISRRGRKRSRKDNDDNVFGYNNVKWIEDDDEEDEEWNIGDRRSKRTRHGHSGSDQSMTTTSDEPSNLYEVVVKSEIMITDGDDEEEEEDDDDDPLAHIKMLQRELYKIFKNQKSSSSSSSSCSSLAESPPEEDQVLIYNPSYNPHFSENEIGFGRFLLKPP